MSYYGQGADWDVEGEAVVPEYDTSDTKQAQLQHAMEDTRQELGTAGEVLNGREQVLYQAEQALATNPDVKTGWAAQAAEQARQAMVNEGPAPLPEAYRHRKEQMWGQAAQQSAHISDSQEQVASAAPVSTEEYLSATPDLATAANTNQAEIALQKGKTPEDGFQAWMDGISTMADTHYAEREDA